MPRLRLGTAQYFNELIALVLNFRHKILTWGVFQTIFYVSRIVIHMIPQKIKFATNSCIIFLQDMPQRSWNIIIIIKYIVYNMSLPLLTIDYSLFSFYKLSYLLFMISSFYYCFLCILQRKGYTNPTARDIMVFSHWHVNHSYRILYNGLYTFYN